MEFNLFGMFARAHTLALAELCSSIERHFPPADAYGKSRFVLSLLVSNMAAWALCVSAFAEMLQIVYECSTG